MRVIAFWSGGKDCAWACRQAEASGEHAVVALLTTYDALSNALPFHGVDLGLIAAQAARHLRGELATLAVGAASAVVNKNLDPAAQTQLIEDYINLVGTR